MASFVFRILVIVAMIASIINAQCSSGEECSVSCQNGMATACPTDIDGSSATYLNVNCTGNICQNRSITCPIAGCTINCNGDYACRGMTIEYNGIVNDDGNISINCEGSLYTCYYMNINAMYINNIEITCISSSLTYFYGPCGYTLNADYANNVIINNNEGYASYKDIWNLANAKNVMLNTRGFCMSCIHNLLIYV